MSLKSFGYLDLGADTETAIKLMSQWVNLKDIKSVTINNASAVALTPAQVINSVIIRTGSSTPADTVPTAAAIVAAIPNCAVGDTYVFWIRNGGSGVLTLTTSAGNTLSGTMTVTNAQIKMFMGVVTAVGTPAVTVYSMTASAAF